MDSKKELEAKLKQMESEIGTCSDKELDMMGLETSVLVAVMTQQLGEEHENTQACRQLLNILRGEFERRNGKKPEDNVQEQAKPKEILVIPKTFNELMCLGDASVEEPVMVNKI